jgi:single-strand DNA-binding protein
VNKVILVGRLTRDPEVRTTNSGKFVTTFTLAVNRFGQNDTADFVPIVAWDKLAEICGNSVTKGQRVLVDGRLQIRAYEKDGQKRWMTEVIAQSIEFLERKTQSAGAPNQTDSDKHMDDAGSFGKDVFPGEEIPF